MSTKLRKCCCGNRDPIVDLEIPDQPAVVCTDCHREVIGRSVTNACEKWNNSIASRKRWKAAGNNYKRDPFPRPLTTGVKTFRDKLQQLVRLVGVIEDKKLRQDMQDRMRIMRRTLERSSEHKD